MYFLAPKAPKRSEICMFWRRGRQNARKYVWFGAEDAEALRNMYVLAPKAPKRSKICMVWRRRRRNGQKCVWFGAEGAQTLENIYVLAPKAPKRSKICKFATARSRLPCFQRKSGVLRSLCPPRAREAKKLIFPLKTGLFPRGRGGAGRGAARRGAARGAARGGTGPRLGLELG